MFKELIDFWKGKETLFDEVVRDFKQMIKTGHFMLQKANRALFHDGTFENLKADIYKHDGTINQLEKGIRRKIMTLLSGGTEEPIAASLILMSISKDAERIGDYAKNIVEVFEVCPELGKTEPYYSRMTDVKDKMNKLFEDLLVAYDKGDQILAKQLVQRSYEHRKLCDQNVRELLTAAPDQNFVAYVLLSRFYKRVLAHISNIATSIFTPVTSIDFFDHIREIPEDEEEDT